MGEAPRPLTTEEAAAALGLTIKTIRKQVERGKLTAGRFGRQLTFDLAEVERYRRENLGRNGNPAWRRPD